MRPVYGVDGGLNPRISGDEATIGTEFAVEPLAARWLGGQVPVNAASRHRRWPEASVYRGLFPRSQSFVELGGCLLWPAVLVAIDRPERTRRRICADFRR